MAKGQLAALNAKGAGVALWGKATDLWPLADFSCVSCPPPHPISTPFIPSFPPSLPSPFPLSPLPLGLLSSLPSLLRYPQGNRDTLTWHSAGLVHGLACSWDP